MAEPEPSVAPAEDQIQPSPSTPIEDAAPDEPNNMKSKTKNLTTILLATVVVILGVGTGFGLSRVTAGKQVSSTPTVDTSTPTDSSEVKSGETYGSSSDTFIDEAKGVIIDGGINGEGTHRLLRPGGESQIICLTSSVIDLDLFIDHEISIWGGETFDTQTCGWFMDVGRVTVEQLDAEKPFIAEE